MAERALPVTILEPAGIDPDLLDHSLSLRFDLGQFDERITFTRNSFATYFGSDGLLKTAAANEPRIDYDPVTGECKGFLVEEQRTNLLTYSEQFENAAWLRSRVTITPNAIVAPDGTLTVDKLVENASSDAHYIEQHFSTTSGTTYTLSFFAKGDGSGRKLNIRTALQGNAHVAFDLSTGVGEVTTGDSLVSHGSVNVGNGWYRCWIVCTATGSGNAIFRAQLYTNTFNYTGDGTSGVYIWGAQLEVGTFPTSYIKTEATAATRAADSAVMTGENFSSWYRQDEGALLWDGEIANTGVTPTGGHAFNALFDIDNGTTNPHSSFVAFASAGYGPGVNLGIGDLSVTRSRSAPIALPNSSIKVSLGYSQSSSGMALNGTHYTFPAELTQSPFAASRLCIGGQNAGGGMNALSGRIRRISYYPKRLANEKLQALTA